MAEPPPVPTIDPARLADRIVEACWANPGEPYTFMLTAEAVELIVRALREFGALRTPN